MISHCTTLKYISHIFGTFCFLSPLAVLLLFASCSSPRPGTQAGSNLLHHASLLELEEADSFTIAHVRNPWKPEQMLATYVLVPRTSPLPHCLPHGTLVRTPVKRAVMGSSVHAALVIELQARAQMAGLMDADYAVSPSVRRHVGNGQGMMKPMGSSIQPDAELIRSAHADVLLLSPFENAGHGAISRLQVPIIECADYMETSPLGRAEWMRFYGRLFGQGERADSLFQQVEEAYSALCQKASTSQKRPTVMCDALLGATWYEPGGESTMGRLFADAGARYLWADRKEAGSLQLDLESVFARGRDADIWLVKYGAPTDWTYASMKADNARYALFRPWKEHRIWGCNTLHVPFFEETPFHPERLLANLISIFHPEIPTAKDSPAYYTPLSPARP